MLLKPIHRHALNRLYKRQALNEENALFPKEINYTDFPVFSVLLTIGYVSKTMDGRYYLNENVLIKKKFLWKIIAK